MQRSSLICSRGQVTSPTAWRANLPDEQNGLVVLGTPLGKNAFVRAHATKRMQTEQVLLDRLMDLSDLQCQWVILSQCAVPGPTTLCGLCRLLCRRSMRCHTMTLYGKAFAQLSVLNTLLQTLSPIGLPPSRTSWWTGIAVCSTTRTNRILGFVGHDPFSNGRQNTRPG